jgi:hypothetical protein
MPLLKPWLTGENYDRALRKLQRKEGLSKGEARKALRRLEVTYVVSIVKAGGAGAASVIPARTFRRASWEYRKKKNQLTARNLKPGSYTLTWRAVIATKRPPVEIGTAVSRFTTKFTIPGRN